MNLSTTTENKLRAYTDILEEWKNKLNLVGKNDDLWERHIMDCLWIAPLIDTHIPKPLSLACIGSGAGLPGIVISIALKRQVTLIESKKKKCLFLLEVKRKLSLDVKVVCKRIEDVDESFEGIMARGLAPLPRLLPLLSPLLTQSGKAFFLKGKTVENEIQEAHKIFDYEKEKIMSPHDPQGCVLLVGGVKERREKKRE